MASVPIFKNVKSSDVGSPEGVVSESDSDERSPPPPNNSVEQIGSDTSAGSNSDGFETPQGFGWVYHMGVNKRGHERHHLRFLCLRGKHVEMYKSDPHDYPDAKPIRKGVIGHTFMMEYLGHRKVNNAYLYAIRLYNRLDEAKTGEIAFATASEPQRWMELFDRAKQQVVDEFPGSDSVSNKLNMEDELNSEGHRHKVQHYARGIKKLFRIQRGAARAKDTYSNPLMPPLWKIGEWMN